LCLFGEVVNGAIKINDAGRLVQSAWGEIPVRFSNLEIDEFIVMPNHIHGILLVGAQFIAPSSVRHDRRNAKQGAINHAPTLGEIVRSFKAASTRMVRRTVRSDFAWQRNYYEHIIRNDESLYRIRHYIQDNPSRWDFDHENPAATNPEPENALRTQITQAAVPQTSACNIWR
jgi:putative transposase